MRLPERRFFLSTCVALIFTTLPSPHAGTALAQGCCSAGGSAAQIGLFRQSHLAPGQASFAFYFGHTQADRSYAGSQNIEDPLDRRASLQTFVGSLSLGLPWGFTAYTAAIAVWRERSLTSSFGGQPVAVDFEASGIADPVVVLSKDLTPQQGTGGWHVSMGAGVQLPLGEDEVRKDGVRLPNDVQPATGDWNLLLLESLSHTRGDWLFYQHAAWTMTWANTVGYRVGNSLRLDAGSSFARMGPVEPFARMDLLFSEPDQSNGRILPSTGATRLYAAPGIAINLRPQRVLLSAELGVPVYQSYTGNQLGSGLTWLLGLSYLL